MKIDPRALVGPLAAFLLLAITLQQTTDALRRSGVWRTQASGPVTTAESPFVKLDTELARRAALSPGNLERDPFRYGWTKPAPTASRTTPRPVQPAPAPRPVLTAIIFDSDPRALVRFDGRDFTVRDNTLFAEFRVVRITRDEVVLDRSGESLVLKRPTGGS